MRRALALLALWAAAACGETSPTDPPRPEARVATIEVVSGANQRMHSGRRSSIPFRVRALDARRDPIAGAEIAFRVSGAGGGDPSQPRALTDESGYAESWLLNPKTGAGAVIAEAGTGRAESTLKAARGAGQMGKIGAGAFRRRSSTAL